MDQIVRISTPRTEGSKAPEPAGGILRPITRLCVRYAEQYIPDPYLYAVILTFISVVAASIWTPSSPMKIIDAWYNGIWSILAFALQMALILAAGVTLANAPIVRRQLQRLAGLPDGQASAAITVFLAAAIGSWLNWGFGLVVGAIVAREIAKRLRKVDFAFLVAAAYMGFMVWASGLSSSIALATATHGSALNVVEKFTGKPGGFDETIFTWYNLVPVVLLVLVIPVTLYFMGPSEAEMKTVDPDLPIKQDEVKQEQPERPTFATRLENAWPISLLLVAMGVAYEWHTIATKGFSLDINGLIFITLMLGLLCHWRPIRYVQAFNAGAKTVGPILLQFWRHGEHGPGALPGCGRPLGLPHGRRHTVRQSAAGRAERCVLRPAFRLAHRGPGHRAADHPRGPGPLGGPLAAAFLRRPGGREVRRGDRAGDAGRPQGTDGVRQGRAQPAGHDGGQPGQAAARFPQGRHDYRRQCARPEHRRRGDDRRRTGLGRAGGADADGAAGVVRGRRGRAGNVRARSGSGGAPGIGARRLVGGGYRAHRDQRGVAAIALAVTRELGLSEDVVNMEGGAIAHGHPIGATGAVLTTRLLHSMARDRVRRGVVTRCIGGGQGIALALQAL